MPTSKLLSLNNVRANCDRAIIVVRLLWFVLISSFVGLAIASFLLFGELPDWFGGTLSLVLRVLVISSLSVDVAVYFVHRYVKSVEVSDAKV